AGSYELLHDWRKAGYIGMLSAAYEQNGKSRAGGITMGTLKKYKVQSMRHLASSPSDQVGLRDLDRRPEAMPGIDFRDMVAMQLRAQGQSLLIVGVYMTSSIGPKANAPKLANVGTLVSTVQGPWLAIGDWNMTPKELAGTGWLGLVNGSVIVPSNTDYTCTLGSGRMLDYIVASPHALPWVESLSADFQAVEGAGKAHYGLQLSLNFDACRARAWLMRRKLAIKSPPPLQYALFDEEDDEFFTDGEDTDVPEDDDDVQVAVSDSEVDTYASTQLEWSSEAKDLLWQQ
ncbi:unnamed protein product, partial [Prorocentrum cordatum]